MDVFITSGIDWVVAVQSLGDWLTAPMRFFTSLGMEQFYILILPILYWCIDASLGLRVGMIMLFSGGVNDVLKLTFQGPRPYWVSSRVAALSAEGSFGVPSGHAQNAVAVWGTMAARIKKAWAWLLAVIIMLLIGLSRIYLGVHFPHDVVVGWLIGILILWAFLRFWQPAALLLKRLSLGRQVLLALGVALGMVLISGALNFQLNGYTLPSEWLANAARAGDEPPDPVSMDGILTSSGAFFGLAAGYAWIVRRGGFRASGAVWKRALRYVVGVIGVLILWYGLGQAFPRGEALLPYILRFVRYALIGAWVSAGAPWLFFRFNLAQPSEQ